jgi:iron complex transport system substrate-binding protein
VNARAKQRLIVSAVAISLIALSFLGAWAAKRERRRADAAEAPPPQRIVSLAPSITEILYSLGLADKIVGVTNYCDYPPEATSKPKIGGYYDPNYEAILAQKPDLVIMLVEHGQVIGKMNDLGLRTLEVAHDSVAGIRSSIAAIGRSCGAASRAQALVANIDARLARVQRMTGGCPRPRVLVSVGRAMGTGSIRDVWAASSDTIYREAVDLAGGTNALDEPAVKYASLSQEGVMALDPDVIIDIVADLADKGISEEDIRRDWAALDSVHAVKAGRVCVLGGDYVEIPGPRVMELVEDIAEAIHPEIDWEAK